MSANIESVVKVCIPHTNHNGFDYDSGSMNVVVGARVWVPFRRSRRVGIVVGKGRSADGPQQLKDIESIIDETPIITQPLLALCQWVSDYYQSFLSEVFALVLPKHYREGKPCSLPSTVSYELATTVGMAHDCLSPRARRQHELVDFIAKSEGSVSRRAIKQAGFSAQLLTLLQKSHLLLTREKPVQAMIHNPFAIEETILTEEQRIAVQTIDEQLNAYRCFLLQGVTGSGKTEVYLQVIKRVLANNKQVLVLVPEIGLTPQLLVRFKQRIQTPMTVIHSQLTPKERQTAWQLAFEAGVNLVIGTRTAVFTPLPNLGLIVIDEEHDASLKQMEGVRYSARDTALMRAHSANIPIILGSATPSLESLYNCNLKKYHLVRLTQKALNKQALKFSILDIRNQTLYEGLAKSTLKRIEHHLKQGNQVLVFINRRGFAPILMCHACGWMADCHSCDTHLTWHRRRNLLMCHHCGGSQAPPLTCLSCHSHPLVPVGSGTQRIHEFLSKQFPQTSLIRLDRDEAPNAKTLTQKLALIHEAQAQLVIGTQMLAKGHHFPRLTLVVVLEADNGFYNHDFRALERLGQVLTQVSGRAGRDKHSGEVLIQTHLPEHPALNLLINEGYEAFADSLLQNRKEAQLPPFHYLALIRAQGKSPQRVLAFLSMLQERLQELSVDILGPAPAPLARKAKYHRMQLLVKSSSRNYLQQALRAMRQWLLTQPFKSGLQWSIDVDPIDLS